MKFLYLIFILFLFCNSAFADIPIEIIKIYDGDTILAKIENNKFPIRLYGIDCYEISANNRAYKQAYLENLNIKEVTEKGKFSKKYLKKLLLNTKIANFEFKGLDNYKRVLGIIYLDQKNINNLMLKEGFCTPYSVSPK